MNRDEIRILFLEDSPADYELAQRELRKAGLNFASLRVSSLQDLLAEIDSFTPHAILADYSLPGFTALDAIQLLKEKGLLPQLPFILFTGTQSEETAVECLKQGADDYILKSKMARLASAVESAISRKKIERDNRILAARLFQLKKAVEALQVGVTITDLDRRILYANPAEAAMHGYGMDEITGMDVRMFAPSQLWNGKLPIEEMKSFKRESTNIRKDGTLFPVELISDVVFEEGNPLFLITVCEDITERKKMEQALHDSEERYELAARGSNEGLWDWNIQENYIYFSPRWKAMLGYAENEIANDPSEWWNRVHPSDRPRVEEEIQKQLEQQAIEFRTEYRMLHRDGTYRWMFSAGLILRDQNGTAYRVAGSQTDITARKAAEQKLLHDAVHDSLTGLPNRILFLDRIQQALQRCVRHADYSFALLFLDLDRFKFVNDSLGHLAGDQLLLGVAQRLQSCLRPGDSVARFGGDEFAVFLDDVPNAVSAIHVANRIQYEFSRPFSVRGTELFTSASIGIALSSPHYGEPQEMLRDADVAMYRAKKNGRARHELFDSGMRTSAMELLTLENDLRRAIQRNEFRVYYQPIVDLRKTKIVGLEALLRWRHPTRGFLVPADFVPFAEEAGFIGAIGKSVLQSACRQISQWQQQGLIQDEYVSVNLSGKQLYNSDIVSQIQNALDERRLSPANLKLEITETAIMDNYQWATSILAQINNLQVQLYLDDFGTGYSSLSYIHRFPIQGLKIDRSFVSTLDSDFGNKEIVRTIIMLAKNLGIDAIAEGIETAEQLAQLKLLGCNTGQGFFFSRPTSIRKTSNFLQDPESLRRAHPD